MSLPGQRTVLNLTEIYNLLPNGVGDYLRYEPVYDKIKNARIEENDGLSRGIWQTDLKHADWILVESLSHDVLLNQSKDLQIACWLAESWVKMDKLDGMIRGNDFILNFCQNFWQEMYPKIEQNDLDYRAQIFEWWRKTLEENIATFPISDESNGVIDQPLTYADWNFALNLDRISRRGADGQKALQDAVKRGRLTLEKFRTMLLSIPLDFLIIRKQQTLGLINALKSLGDFIDEKLANYTISFAAVIHSCNEIIRMCDFAINKLSQQKLTSMQASKQENSMTEDFLNPQDNSANAPSAKSGTDDDVTVADRKTAYHALKEIAGFLQQLDPHSLTPYFLNLLVGWESKSLPQILADIGKEPPETAAILNMLAAAANNNKSKVTTND